MSRSAARRVALAAVLPAVLAGCGPWSSPTGGGPTEPAAWASPVPGGYGRTGRLPVPEASGVVASRQWPGVFWAHPDGGRGDRDVLVAFKVRRGRLVELTPGTVFRRVALPGLDNRDWEDIAADDEGHLWLGDTGDNGWDRTDTAVHKIAEPDPYTAASAEVVASYRYRWPDDHCDCPGGNAESLLVVDGVPYLVSNEEEPGLFGFATLSADTGNVLEEVGDLTPPRGGFPDPPTGADVSTDRRRLSVATDGHQVFVYETPTAGLSGEELVADLVARPPAFNQRYRRGDGYEQIEGVAFVPGRHDLVLTSEDTDMLYFPDWFYERPDGPVRDSSPSTSSTDG